MNINEPYRASFTREQFLFHEMRIVAELMSDGKDDNDIVNCIVDENLFQYPTEKMIRRMAMTCVKRLNLLSDNKLIDIIAHGPSDSAKQVCLYAMMNQYRVIFEFMTSVIAEKYRLRDYSFSRKDLNVFFVRLQEQSDAVASWKESTISKLKQVIMKMLVDTEFLDNVKSDHLNSILIDFEFKNVLIEKRDYAALSVFNCFEGD